MEISSLSLSLGSVDPKGTPLSACQRRNRRHVPVLSKLITFLALILFAEVFATSAQAAENYPEGAVKAVMLYNLPDFTEWPASELKESDTEIKACLLGKPPFQKHFNLFQGRPLKGRTLDIRSIDDPKQATNCHLVVITPTSKKQLSSILDSLSGTSVLTISDSPGFAAAGGMIELTTVDQRIRLIVNLASAKKAGLQLHSSLLDLATIVGNSNDDQ